MSFEGNGNEGFYIDHRDQFLIERVQPVPDFVNVVRQHGFATQEHGPFDTVGIGHGHFLRPQKIRDLLRHAAHAKVVRHVPRAIKLRDHGAIVVQFTDDRL